jgi:hypothetical protein
VTNAVGREVDAGVPDRPRDATAEEQPPDAVTWAGCDDHGPGDAEGSHDGDPEHRLDHRAAVGVTHGERDAEADGGRRQEQDDAHPRPHGGALPLAHGDKSVAARCRRQEVISLGRWEIFPA